jgi:murein DD-endopeptidase MepM/ murein hydrolase activator NlpD
MRRVVARKRSLPWNSLAIVAGISAAVAGCSADMQRFDADLFGSSPPQARGEVTGSLPQHGKSVQSAPLPPPSASAPVTRPAAGGIAGGSPGMASYHPGAAGGDITGSVAQKPSKPVSATSSRPGWHWEGGTPVTVGPGETVDTLAHRYGVPVSAIVQANNLPGPAAVRPGQRLVIPRYEAPTTTGSVNAPRAAAAPAPQPTASGNHVHVVAPGETLMKLSRQYNKSLSEIAKANNIAPHTMVKVGDRIVIPGVRAPQQALTAQKPAAAAAPHKPQPAPKVAAVQTTPSSAPASNQAGGSARMATPAAEQPEPEKAKVDSTAAAMPAFRWPVRGRVIAGFGPKTTGQQNDGINVAVPEGTPIKAAEDGVVAYAGNELKSYGNLVLVRHANGYVTAYAHASEILVKRDEPVKRGQVIAKAGQTGNVASPQVHFEIRKGSTPVDPMPFLERGGNS